MAKRFSFRLEPVLRLRAHKVNRAKEDLVAIVNRRVTKEQQIEERESYYDSLLTTERKTTRAGDLQAIINHEDFVKGEIEKLENEKSQLLEIEVLRRSKLTDAMKEEKVLEKLKEKKKNAHSEELAKEDTQFMDEIARKAQSGIEKF